MAYPFRVPQGFIHALDVLTHPVRSVILLAERGCPLAVHEVAAKFGFSRPASSRHLRVLEDARAS